MKETYLGDGLYASFDGWSIRLRAPRPNGDHEVFLEDSVLANFMEFIGSLGLIKARERAANVVANDRRNENETTKRS